MEQEKDTKNCFNQALSNFAFDAACGGAIRHLADLGFSVKQIQERLDFPTPFEKVQKAVYEYYFSTGILLSEEPTQGKVPPKVTYVRDYDKYGKTSFRRIVEEDTEYSTKTQWKEQTVTVEEFEGKRLLELLHKKCEENGEKFSYASCDFGVLAVEKPEEYKKIKEQLNERQREYIAGIPWEKKRIYHRLTSGMLEIISRLYEDGLYEGSCYFMKSQEKIRVGTV